MPTFSSGPLLQQQSLFNAIAGAINTGGGSSGGGDSAQASATAPQAPAPSKKGIFVGVIASGDIVEVRRSYVRFKISDLPSGVISARLRWYYADKAQPTGDVALVEINDFVSLGVEDWNATERAVINASAVTPASAVATKLTFDVTTRYNQAKTDGLTIFALKLQYSKETEGVGVGRWYEFGATGNIAPTLELTITTGGDMAMTLLAIPLTVNLADPDALGTLAATVLTGDTTLYPPVGSEVRLGASIDGLTDDAAGLYTGTPGAIIERGSDIIYFLWHSRDEGAGIETGKLDLESLATARTRLADWFMLVGGLTSQQDVRTWVAQICQSIRAFAFVDQLGRDALYVDPLDSVSTAPVRLITPDEHGPLRLFPIQTTSGALFPISRTAVFYGLDYLGIDGYRAHALISADETEPADAMRQAQAIEAEARYGLRGLGGEPIEASPETSYPWVPLETPGILTGVRIRDWQWDRARARPLPAHGIEIMLPRFALGFRLLDRVDIESTMFPSSLARLTLTATPVFGTTESGPLAYQCRRARCVVRDLPRLMAESGSDFPVQIIAQIEAWDTA